MGNKNSKLFIVVALLLIVGAGTSFAYFLVGASFKGEGATANVSTGPLPLVQYDAGSSTLSKDNLMPKEIISKTFKVIVTPTNDIKEVTYRIFIDITSNTFVKCTNDNYDEFENACELNAEELIYRLKDSSGNVIKSGDLTGLTGQIEIARETKTQDVKTEYNYTIEVEFKDTGKDQNHNQNVNFNGNTNVEYAEEGMTIDDIIAKSNPKPETEVPDFSQTATEDEGVYSTSDGMYSGTTYYWRGAATTNHVIFANKCWRIVRINGDKTMRLIYNGSVQENNTCFGNGANADSIAVTYQAYNSGIDQSNYAGWSYEGELQRPTNNNNATSSNAKIQTENWYDNNIGNNATYNSKVADGKFCNNRNAGNGYTWSIKSDSTSYYEEYTNRQNGTPSTSCPSGDVYTLKVGAITASEVMFAGGGYMTMNTTYYLYNRLNYWTMTPCAWDSDVRAFIVLAGGDLAPRVLDITNTDLRPVINLKSDTLFAKDGLGTSSKPYICL